MDIFFFLFRQGESSLYNRVETISSERWKLVTQCPKKKSKNTLLWDTVFPQKDTRQLERCFTKLQWTIHQRSAIFQETSWKVLGFLHFYEYKFFTNCSFEHLDSSSEEAVETFRETTRYFMFNLWKFFFCWKNYFFRNRLLSYIFPQDT